MTRSNSDLTATLEKMPLFSGMSSKDISRAVSTAVRRSYPAGTRIVEDGRGGIGFYLILGGRVQVAKDGQDVAELASGDFFGETALLVEDRRRSADVVAVEDTECLVMSSWDFQAFVETNSAAAARIARELAKRESP